MRITISTVENGFHIRDYVQSKEFVFNNLNDLRDKVKSILDELESIKLEEDLLNEKP